MAGGISVAIPSSLANLQQQGLLERAFHDGLFPNLAYRAEAMPEEWPQNTGTQIFMTRPGLMKPNVTPNQPGSDPVGQTIPFEQWVAQLNQFADSIDTHMPTAVTSNANLFLRNIHQLGLQAGQSINRIARNALFQAYLSGQTYTTIQAQSTDTTLTVASLNGFTSVVIPGGNVAPQPVSTAFPLAITINGTTTASVIGFAPLTSDPNGPGQLTLAAAVGTTMPATRVTVASAYAPRILRASAGGGIDAVGSGDILTLQQIINAAGYLRLANVQPHEDGFYHAHISPTANSQIFADPVFQRLNQSLPEHIIYKQGFIGEMGGVLFYMNNESPTTFNVGTLSATAGSAQYAPELGSEIVNGAGVAIGFVIITGRGAMYEKYLDESSFVTEAGTTGKIGEFDVVNNNIAILTERIRLVLRAPIDKLQQVVTASWSISTSFPIPSDVTAPSGPQLYKRAVVLQFAA